MTRWVWLRRGNVGASERRPDDTAFTEWWPHGVTLHIPSTRWTHSARLGVRIKPLRLWLHVNERKRSKYA